MSGASGAGRDSPIGADDNNEEVRQDAPRAKFPPGFPLPSPSNNPSHITPPIICFPPSSHASCQTPSPILRIPSYAFGEDTTRSDIG